LIYPPKNWFDGASSKMANTHNHEMEKIIKVVVYNASLVFFPFDKVTSMDHATV